MQFKVVQDGPILIMSTRYPPLEDYVHSIKRWYSLLAVNI